MKSLIVIIRIILIPFSLLYGFLTELRNLLFDWHLLPIYKSKLPVVSVGNISVGGTGKTPFTIWLAQQLSGHFERIAIVSRGYRRSSKGLKTVAENGKILCNVEVSGDEPMLMAQKLKNALIIVAEKRKKAIRHIEMTQAADVIILDDAFQHRWVARDADIVLLHQNGFLQNWPLPTGRLREMIWRLNRATYLIRRASKDNPLFTNYVPENRQFTAHFSLGDVVNELFEIQGRIEQWRGKRVVAFAGIAHPQTFFDMLRQNGLEVVQTIAFADHYRFREDDLSELVHLCRKEKAEWLLCTEKDLVKIQPFLPILETEIKITDVCLGAVSLQVQLDDAKKFLDDLLKRLTIE